MTFELPAQATAAIATFAATLITSLVALVNLTLTKESKVSEMRRDWIEALRTELADYFQSMRHIANAVEEMNDPTPDFKRTKIEEALQSANTSYYRIRLRLNEKKPLHNDLRAAVDEVEEVYRNFDDSAENLGDRIVAQIEAAIPASRALIDGEWQRVKQGERAYRNLRNWIVPGSLAVVVVFVMALSLISFK